jgi:hypothetical protein
MVEVMKSEAAVQTDIRLEASRRGARLWRNNVGALPGPSGIPVRYGLANESKRMNEAIKSSDLIGITPVVITQEMVGRTLGVFTSYEVKQEGWKFTGSKREVAQAAWIRLVKAFGGYARFVSDVSNLYD